MFNDLQEISQFLPETSFWNPLRDPLESLINQLIPSKLSETDNGRQTLEEEKVKEIKNKIKTLTRDHLEFAEQNEVSGILPIPPIQQLVNLPDEKLPIAVILGSKGAGKTFLWSQLAMAKSFAKFAKIVSVKDNEPWKASKPALIFPLLCPRETLENPLRPSPGLLKSLAVTGESESYADPL